MSIWSGTTGELDEVPVADIKRFEADFLDNLTREHNEILTTIRETGELSDDTVASLKAALNDFKLGFTTSDGQRLVCRSRRWRRCLRRTSWSPRSSGRCGADGRRLTTHGEPSSGSTGGAFVPSRRPRRSRRRWVDRLLAHRQGAAGF